MFSSRSMKLFPTSNVRNFGWERSVQFWQGPRHTRQSYVLLKPLETRDAVMAEIQLLEVLEVLQAFQLRDTIRLY